MSQEPDSMPPVAAERLAPVRIALRMGALAKREASNAATSKQHILPRAGIERAFDRDRQAAAGGGQRPVIDTNFQRKAGRPSTRLAPRIGSSVARQ